MHALLLLLVLLGPEQQTEPRLYDPPAVRVATPAVALARDGQGVAMAWSMRTADRVSHIHIARLDRFGQTGPIRELPVALTTGRTDAVHPSLSRRAGADGFLLTWIEERDGLSRAAYSLLDSTLAPESPALLPGVRLTSPALAYTGAVMWVTSNGQFWEIEANGAARGPFDAMWPASDITAPVTEVPFLVSGWRDPNVWTCDPASGCTIGSFPGIKVCKEECRIRKSSLRLVMPYDVIETTLLDYRTEAEPAVESDGGKLVMAWFRGAQATGGDVVAAIIDPLTAPTFRSAIQAPLVLGRFGPDSGPTRPDIAVTERGTYVVWRTSSPGGDHDVAGALLRRDGTVEQFTVAESEADERDPSILALENGELLVAYVKIESGESRIAWRVIGSQARRRVVR